MPVATLTAEVVIDDKLEFTYELTNEGEVPLYVFAALWSTNDEGQVIEDPRPCYVSIDERGILQLGQVVHPYPTQKLVEQRLVPYARSVAAGEKWQGKLSLDLPVQEYNPYYPSNDKTMQDEVALTAVRLCVDFVVHGEQLKLHRSSLAEAHRLEHPQLFQLIQRVSSERLPIAAQGLRRTDKFERFAC